ncbi:hypothetical protein SteCoe_35885 [Stentor coeruleus]|uniref:Uncharacterized protein n=1 Tax=Stentor coeruleus TaxID=5963 RepID=A0A1R2ARD1_9CILI|nr:hypothetical protein SteCoe_35885 [Stentor coeruleus]
MRKIIKTSSKDAKVAPKFGTVIDLDDDTKYFETSGNHSSPMRNENFMIDTESKIFYTSGKSDKKLKESTCELSLNLIDTFANNIKPKLIEEYEIQLYYIKEKFHESSCGELKISDLLLSFPMFRNAGNIEDDNFLVKTPAIDDSFNILSRDSLLPIRHKIMVELCEIISALLVKWNIFNKQKYEYRASIRSSNIKIIDMKIINSNTFNIEIIWFCAAIKEKLIPQLTTTELYQYSELLQNQTNNVFRLMIDDYKECIPSIEDAVGIKSRNYREKCLKRKPVPFIGMNCYTELKYPSLIRKLYYKKKLSESVALANAIVDLENIYRMFERELIGRFLLII